MSLRKVVFYLGLHKTGTTGVQRYFGAQQSLLEARGVNYVPLPEMRATLTQLIIRPLKEEREALKAYFAHVPQPYLLLSDENILGGVTDPLSGALYPEAESRVTSLQSTLEGIETHFVVALRSPHTFLPALYGEYLRHERYVPFDEYVARLPLDELSFGDMFGWTKTSRRGAVWHFIPFETELGGGVPTIAATITSLLTDDATLALGEFPSERVRRSLTAEEVALIDAAVRDEDAGFATRLARFLQEQDQRWGATPYRPLAGERADKLWQRYCQDVPDLNAR